MNALTRYQVIEQEGNPVFVVVPYHEFMARFVEPVEDGLIPHEIIERHALNGVSIVKCWREYLNLTQAVVAKESGVKQPAIARIEANAGYKPRASTLEKIAKAMGLSLGQLLVDG